MARKLQSRDQLGDVFMKFRKIMTAVTAIGLIASPTLAAGPNAAPSEVLPAGENVDAEGQIYGASVILQIGILVAVAIAIYFGAKALGGDDDPASP